MRSFLHSHRVIFLIGDMRELGKEEESLHKQLANEILDLFPDDSDIAFVFVGPLMLKYVVPIVSERFETSHFFSSRNAGNHIESMLNKEKRPTMIYVKGSQNTIFLEEGIKQFLVSDDETKKLCRQSPEWMEKKEIFFRNLSEA